MNIAREHITAGILAGGQARRLGGIDKGWYEFHGKPLIAHVLARVAPQCGPVVISANRSLDRYRALGHPVCRDAGPGFQGPLAGLLALLQAAETPYVLVLPVDAPLLPADLAVRLAAAMEPRTAIALARSGERIHRLHALMRRSLCDNLAAVLASGTRAVRDWQAGLASVAVEWPDATAFANINSVEDAAALSAAGLARPV